MGEPPMGNHSPSFEQTENRQGEGHGMSATLGVSTLVEDTFGDDDLQSSDYQGTPDFSGSRRGHLTSTTLGNPFGYCSGVNSWKLSRLADTLRLLESLHDVPPKLRISWLQDTLTQTTLPRHRTALTQCMGRLSSKKAKPKYPQFYDVQPILDLAFHKPDVPLLVRCLLQLRLTTLMRSVDASRVVWGLFDDDGRYYIQTTEKQGNALTFSIAGSTLATVIEYLHVYRNDPALFMFRYTT